MHVSKTDKACAAGWLDGEGCIYMLRKPYKGRFNYQLGVSITNTDVRPLDWFNARWPGAIYSVRKANGTGWRTCHRWVISRNNDIKDFLLDVRDYLIIKGDQADVAIEHCDWRATLPHHCHSKAYQERSEAVRSTLSSMKGRV